MVPFTKTTQSEAHQIVSDEEQDKIESNLEHLGQERLSNVAPQDREALLQDVASDAD